MQIIKPIEFTNKIKPFIMYRPILDSENNIVRNMAITDDCILYDYDEINDCKYYGDISPSDFPVRKDKNGRLYANVCQEGKRCQHLARVAKIAFDEEHRSVEYFKGLQADHINPSIPLDNNITNINFETGKQNMINAGKTGVMIKKYKKPLINDICQAICDGKSRQEIKNEFKVNGQLIDDIRAGRSHTSVSEQYLDKGFEYKSFSKTERRVYAHKVCELLEQGYSKKEISEKIPDLPNKSFIKTIKNKMAYSDVISQYNF